MFKEMDKFMLQQQQSLSVKLIVLTRVTIE